MGQQGATEYLRTLSELILSTQVTNGIGTALSLDEAAAQAVQMFLIAKRESRKVFLTGNGGSAAIVSHVQSDLCKAVGVRALVFTEQPMLTAFANDDGYGSVYERPVQLWAEPGDILWAVSSSGRSENILRGVRAASQLGCEVITFSGFRPDNPLRQMGELNFYIGSEVYGYVETGHAALAHFMTDLARSITTTPARVQTQG